MDLVPTKNAITAQEYLSREDMSLVLHSMKTDVTLLALPLNQGTEIKKKMLNFIPINHYFKGYMFHK